MFRKDFVKLTKKKTVVKVLKEHYLRDDIACGLVCEVCSSTEETHTLDFGTIIIPDTNIFIHQMDIIEHFAIKNVVVLQTVLEELRGHAISLYERLRKIIANGEKKFFVFSNEHHKDVYVEKEENESINDRNDRAIRIAANWYKQHASSMMSDSQACKIVFLSDDRDNREKAKLLGLEAFNTIEFVEKITEHPELLDMVSEPDSSPKEDFKYADYVTDALSDKKYIKGTLNVSSYNCFEGSIFADYNGEMVGISISGRMNMNRAIHNDAVLVEILPESEWNSEEVAAVDESEGADSLEKKESKNKKISGKVVAISKRKWRAYCGTIDKQTVRPGNGIQYVLVTPMDKRIPKIRIKTRQANNLVSRRIIVQIDSWDAQSKYPAGHYVRNLGESGDRETETEALLLEHDVPYTPFSKQVTDCLPKEGDQWKPSEEDYRIRRDLRALNVCSIDPPGCTDIDDALHVIQLENGNYQVGVHIADVTHFVKPNTAMDTEAASRGTTVYLVDRRIDMLPSLLGTNLCSLRSNVERFAFSAIWEMSEEGDILSEWFGKSIIQSKASLTYDQAQQKIDDPNAQDDIALSVRSLNRIAKKLRHKRMLAGALTLASPEVRFRLENDSQDPVDVEMKELKEANALVEEFMLLANIRVAQKIYQHFPEVCLLRRHPIPPPDNFSALQEMLKTKNLSLDISNSKALADSLDKCVLEDTYFNKLVRIMTTRCMMQAVYFCSGTIPSVDFVHYGLATDIYTHFTSPIRRFSDIMVHRLLDAAINQFSEMSLSKQKMVEICENLNYRHRMAQQSGRSSVELFTCLFFKGKMMDDEEGFVFKVLQNGIVVFIPKYGIEGVVHLDDYMDSLTFHPESFQFCMEGKPFISIFDKVKISISMGDDVDLSRRKIKVSLIHPALPVASEKKRKMQ